MSPNAVLGVATAKARAHAFAAGLAMLVVVGFPSAAPAQDVTDPVTGFARTPVHVAAWPGGKKVAVKLRAVH